MSSRNGIFNRQIYHCPVTNYHVFSFQDDTKGAIVVVYNGVLVPRCATQRMVIHGKWQTSPVYGERFRMNRFQTEMNYMAASNTHRRQIDLLMDFLEA